MTDADVLVENHGSIFLFRLLSPAASSWVDEFVDPDATFFGGALVVEHRYVSDIADGMMGDGLVLSDGMVLQ